MMQRSRGLTAVLASLVLVGVGSLVVSHKANAAGEGKITGTVKFDGAPPHQRGIDMSKDPYCSKAHANDPAQMETVVVGKNGGLENCVYTPHVLAMDVNQDFKVETSDQTAHNIHPEPNPLTGNIPWNQSQPPGAAPITKSWKAPEMIHVKCNIHPWMSGYFAVVKGPYATTNED